MVSRARRSAARAACVAALALLCAAAAPAFPPPPALPRNPDPNRPEQAVAAADFLNSLGINIGPSPRVNDRIPEYAKMIRYLGVRNLRGSASDPTGNTARYMTTLANAADARVIYGAPTKGGTGERMYSVELPEIRVLAAAGRLLAVEGPNEPETWPVTYNGVRTDRDVSWRPLAELMRDFYAAMKSDPALRRYPVASVSHNGAQPDDVGLQFLKIPEGAGALMPAGTTYADMANMHNYVIWKDAAEPVDNAAWHAADPTGDVLGRQYTLPQDYGTTWLRKHRGYSGAQLAALPRITTETGWPSDNGGLEASGKTLLNVYLAQFLRGYSYTFIYQLKDQEGGFANTFGMFTATREPKPVARWVHNMTTILSDGSAPAAPGVLGWSIEGVPNDAFGHPTVHAFLLQKSDGRFWLVVWNERWPAKRDEIEVRLGAEARRVRLYDPTLGVEPQAKFESVSCVALTMTDHPVFLEIDP
ncbi:glycosyl hydrolase [Methylocella sp.]|uniref:glycosyl hydrolase n=1 Tax=Methylocella sp. TaxID=1978226 RepID=UPI003784B1B6